MARRNLARAGVQANLRQGNVEALPYPDASFDTVVNTMAFTGYPDGAKAMSELARVLRPGGRLVMIDIGYPRDGNRIGTSLVGLWKRAGDLIRDMTVLFSPNPDSPSLTRRSAGGAASTATWRPNAARLRRQSDDHGGRCSTGITLICRRPIATRCHDDLLDRPRSCRCACTCSHCLLLDRSVSSLHSGPDVDIVSSAGRYGAMLRSTQNSLPSGSAITTQLCSPWPRSTRLAPRPISRSTSSLWRASIGMTSRWSRFFATLSSGSRGTNQEPVAGAEACLRAARLDLLRPDQDLDVQCVGLASRTGGYSRSPHRVRACTARPRQVRGPQAGRMSHPRAQRSRRVDPPAAVPPQRGLRSGGSQRPPPRWLPPCPPSSNTTTSVATPTGRAGPK